MTWITCALRKELEFSWDLLFLLNDSGKLVTKEADKKRARDQKASHSVHDLNPNWLLLVLKKLQIIFGYHKQCGLFFLFQSTKILKEFEREVFPENTQKFVSAMQKFDNCFAMRNYI